MIFNTEAKQVKFGIGLKNGLVPIGKFLLQPSRR